MSKLSLSVFLNAYDDNRSSNAPSRSPIKWARDLQGILVSNPKSEDYTIAPGETRVLFSGTRTIAQDGTTEYNLALKPSTSSTYVLSWASGTKPDFRTPRVTGADATTSVDVSLNGPVVTFTSTAGTPFALISGGAVVGDWAFIGNLFNIANQGAYQIVALTATSLSVINQLAVTETGIVLGSGFADQVQIYSAAGVQAGDTLVINAGFSSASWGSYKITAVYAESLEFSATAILPQESSIQTNVNIYSAAKSLVYMESDSNIQVSLNGSSSPSLTIQPILTTGCCSLGGAANSQPNAAGQQVTPGMLMLKSTIFSLSVTNNGSDAAQVFLAAVE